MPKQKKSAAPALPPLSLIYRKIAISFVVLTALLVGIIIFFSLSKATIAVTPKQELKTAEFLVTVQANPGSDQGGAVKGVYEEKVVEDEGQFEATGLTNKAGRSEGTVTLENISAIPQALVATTRLLSKDGVLFRMKSAATVPAQGKVDVAVYADQAGAAGDIGPNPFRIPGLNLAKQKLVYGSSSAAMTGGAQKVRTVTAEDIEKAKADIAERATKKVSDEFAKTPAAALGGVVASSDIKEITVDAKKGDERQTFTVKATLTAQLLAYDKAAIEKMAFDKVLERIPTDRELVTFNKDAIIVRIKNVQKDKGEAQISVYADAEVRINAASPLLDTVKIAGMLPEEAVQYLKSFDAIEDVSVSLFPSWQKRIPTIPDRIKVVIKK